MRTARLGRTDINISVVGFGAWAVGGGDYPWGWGPQDDRDSLAAIRRAIDGGVNWIDTAPAYGVGRSERVVGECLRQLPSDSRPLVFTKCGLYRERDDRALPAERILTPQTVRIELEASLRRLQ